MKSQAHPNRRRHQRPPLSRDRVIAAAVALADADGLAAVSMRRVATALQVEAMSLYNHVSNKEELLDGMVDLVIGEISLPAPDGDWREEMRRRAVSAHEALLRHPWALQLILSRINVGPAMLRYIDAILGCLHTAGFDYPLADHAWNAIDSHVYGFTVVRQSFPMNPAEFAPAAEHYLPLLPANTYPHMHALTELVARGTHSGVNDFAFGLELILDGLERLLEAEQR